jgi:hypothetical protein
MVEFARSDSGRHPGASESGAQDYAGRKRVTKGQVGLSVLFVRLLPEGHPATGHKPWPFPRQSRREAKAGELVTGHDANWFGQETGLPNLLGDTGCPVPTNLVGAGVNAMVASVGA